MTNRNYTGWNDYHYRDFDERSREGEECGQGPAEFATERDEETGELYAVWEGDFGTFEVLTVENCVRIARALGLRVTR